MEIYKLLKLLFFCNYCNLFIYIYFCDKSKYANVSLLLNDNGEFNLQSASIQKQNAQYFSISQLFKLLKKKYKTLFLSSFLIRIRSVKLFAKIASFYLFRCSMCPNKQMKFNCFVFSQKQNIVISFMKKIRQVYANQLLFKNK